LAIFIKPPSYEILEDRLKNRGTESEESIQKRLRKTKQELTFATKFDQVVINDNIEKSYKETFKIVSGFLISK
jgi:guanylate kinase